MNKLSYTVCRRRLIRLWMALSALVFLLFFVQTLIGRFEHHEKDAWHWLFQFITPAFTLIIGVMVAHSRPTRAREDEIEEFYFQLSFYLSGFFLLVLLSAAVVVPIIHSRQNYGVDILNQKDMVQAFKTYDNFTLPLQGLAMLSLGLFFTRR